MYSKKVSTNSGLPENRGAQLGVLGRDADRAGVEVADPHHDAAADTTSGAVAKPNSSAPSSAAMTTSRPVLSWPSTCTTIRSRRPLSSSVCWVSARPSSHGPPACLSEVSGDGAGAAVVAGDEHDVGVRLANAGGDGADADLGDELDVDPGLGVGVLEVVDQLGEVLDRVDVVVRRRADQARRPACECRVLAIHG